LNAFPPLSFGIGAVATLSLANFAANHLFPRHARFAYALLIVILAGTVAPALALKAMRAGGLLPPAAFSIAPWPLAFAVAVGGLYLFLAVRHDEPAQHRRLPKLLIALFAPSLAEVLVFVGVVFTAASVLLTPRIGPLAAKVAAVVTTSAAFGLYHLTHAAPWNSWRMVRILFLVWLLIGGFYAVTGNLWATATLNTLLAMIGFVKNRGTRPEELSAPTLVALDALGIAAVALIVLSP
jgi:hypothetical protein